LKIQTNFDVWVVFDDQLPFWFVKSKVILSHEKYKVIDF
jgi:hypothetical protein